MSDFLKHTKKSGFDIPKEYLDSIDGSLKQKLISSKNSLPKTPGFEVPQDYFERVNQGIKQKVEVSKKGKLVQLFSIHYIAYAASIAAILMLVLNLNKNVTSVEDGLSSVADTMLEEYLQEVVTEYSEDELLQELNVEQLNEVEFVDVSEETMLHYLDEQLEDSLPLYQ
ncbi:hypothetical protein GCM10009117_10410 [Gangjinia marincola]|uniref:Uncharacterized protein n=1 Tax=Gangjinia marincola TaxID=578463 RepID=A0ABP3XRA8_9FLAO